MGRALTQKRIRLIMMLDSEVALSLETDSPYAACLRVQTKHSANLVSFTAS